MRVIAGSAKGRKLLAPQQGQTRPISDRAKEGVFNMLESLGGLEGATVVDLFAGSGSFGIECLSRGAASVTFVEQDRNAVEVLAQNLATTGFEALSTVIAKPVSMALPNMAQSDIAFCDPPYALDAWPQLFAGVNAELLVGHAESKIQLESGWSALRRKKYGRSHIFIVEKPALSELAD